MSNEPNPEHGKLIVFTSNSMRGVLARLGPEFERSSGYTLELSYDPAKIMQRRVESGESADLAILGKPAIDAILEQGKLDRASVRPLARCGVGVAVRSGAPKPDIGSVDAFRRALLDAKSIIHTSEGASGMYFSGLIEKLGVAGEVKAKARTQPGGLVAERVANGEVELGVQQIPELLAVPGVDLVGPLPSEVQTYSVPTAAVFTGSKQREAAQALIDFLVTPSAARTFRERGFEPA